jgi:hypothetical protein
MGIPPRVDWQQIKEHWPAGERCVAIIDRRAIHVILSLFRRFEWIATFDKSQEAIDDWDYIQRIMADAEYELGVAMPLSEIVQYIDEIESLLRALNTHASCCQQPVDWSEGDDFTDPVTDGVGNVPQNIIDAGYADDASDWAGFDDYKCMISHIMIKGMELTLREAIPLFGSSGEILGGLGTLSTLFGTILTTSGPVALAVVGSFASVAGLAVLLLGLGEILTEALADSLADNHDELACAIYNADGSEGAVAALEDKIDELYSDANAALLKAMSLAPMLKALYAGRYDQQDIAQNLADAGFDTADYTCTCELQEVDRDIYGLRWDYQMVVGRPDDDYELKYPYQSDTLNNCGNYVVTPASTGWTWRKDAIGEDGAIENSDADEVLKLSAGCWQQVRRSLLWRFACIDAHTNDANGELKNFEALIEDGEGGYEWVPANMDVDDTSSRLTWDGSTLFVDKSPGTGTWAVLAELEVLNVLVEPW